MTLLKVTEIGESTTVREISVTDSKTTHIVKHYHFRGWTDYQLPTQNTEKEFGSLIDQAAYFVMENIRKASLYREKLVVHCKAGIGRTGTTISLINATVAI